jgi:two-component system, NarL family, invasion response regulator UvrY
MIKVFIVDDHHIFREGLKKVIADTADIIVVGEAGDGREGLRRIPESDCDVVLLDLALQGMDGLEVLQNLRVRKPDLPVLILTMYPEEHYGTRSFQAGASGYLTKESVASDLISAIRKVTQGGCYVSPSLGERLARELSPGPHHGQQLSQPHHGKDENAELVRYAVEHRLVCSMSQPTDV